MTSHISKHDTEEEIVKDKTIPSGFRVAGIKCRSKNSISKEECRLLVNKMVNGLEKEISAMRDAIDKAEIIEEELRGGRVKAFNIIIDSKIAEEIWECVKHEE